MSGFYYIYYGEGDIWIEYPSPILAVDITFNGVYKLESYNPDNFIMNYKNKRLIGIGLGSVLDENPFLKYEGDLRILGCKIVNSDKQLVHIIPKLLRSDRFQNSIDDFDGTRDKFEDMDNIGIFGEIPNKRSVNLITKNLHTKGGEFVLNKGDYKGDYHLHHTGEAMTGADHSDSSEVLTIIGREKRTKQIIRTIKRTPEGRGGRY